MGKLIAIIICVIFSAFFSATETALSTFNKIRMKNLAEKGNKKASLVIKLADNYDTLLTTILIGNNIVNILAASLATLLFTDLLAGKLGADMSATVSTVVLTLVILIFGEISPKTIAKKHPESFSLFVAPIINFLIYVFYPLSFLFNQWQKLLAKIFKNNEDTGMTEEELISIIEEAEEEGGLDEEESTLIKSAIEFNDLEVGDIFTPRIDLTAVSVEDSFDEIREQFKESGFSRLPVYDGDLDNIVGILYYKDFFTFELRAGDSISEIIKPIIYVTKTQKISDLLKELQQKQLHMAIVTDEYGSTAGIVTLEDILEEIVGEIWDEHDEKVEEFKEVGEKEYIISGKANLDKIFSNLEIDEVPEALTINGWAMDELGKVPEVGDTFEALGLSVKVLEMDGRRIENIHVTDIRAAEEDEDEKPRRDKSEEDEDERVSADK